MRIDHQAESPPPSESEQGLRSEVDEKDDDEEREDQLGLASHLRLCIDTDVRGLDRQVPSGGSPQSRIGRCFHSTPESP